MDSLEILVENDKTLQPTILKSFNYIYTDVYKNIMFNCHYEDKTPCGDIVYNDEKNYKYGLEYIEPLNKFIVTNSNETKCLVYTKDYIPDFCVNVGGDGLYSMYEKSFIKQYNGINLYFTNIPRDLFINFGYTHQHLNYNTDTNEFFAYMKTTDCVKEYIKDVYKNGMKSPLLMHEYNGNLYPLQMRIKYFSAFYLNLPIIPICIVDCQQKFTIGILEGKQDTEKLRKLLFPNIIIK